MVRRHIQAWADAQAVPDVFYALEVGPAGARLHGHALQRTDGLRLAPLWSSWHARFGRTTITPILPGERAAVASEYCVKHVWEELFRADGVVRWGLRLNGEAW
ncbi:hypothetical protein [Candidatus Palauibacter sp.]|uniref:hypothetical protein n=1 Tax=Candidatus Palauibacter sp. TaxID=3101350 RepID=UPI003AF30B13